MKKNKKILMLNEPYGFIYRASIKEVKVKKK